MMLDLERFGEWITQMPLPLAIVLIMVMAAGLISPWIILYSSKRRATKAFSTLEAENSELTEQVKKLKHRTNVLARALSERDDTPNTPDGFIRRGLSAEFHESGAKPTLISTESYTRDDAVVNERQGPLLAAKPKRRGPPVLPPDILNEYRKTAVNE